MKKIATKMFKKMGAKKGKKLHIFCGYNYEMRELLNVVFLSFVLVEDGKETIENILYGCESESKAKKIVKHLNKLIN